VRKANFFFCLFLISLLLSCTKETKQEDLVLPASTGKINTISFIIDDVLWNGDVGDSLRKKTRCPGRRPSGRGTAVFHQPVFPENF
jgi:hypothetical protein